jgi:hypothetical protein
MKEKQGMNRVKVFTAPARHKIDIFHSGQRRPLSWVRFTWDLANLSGACAGLPGHYEIVRANAEDEPGLRKVFSSSFILDPIWSPAIAEVMSKVPMALDGAFTSDDKICLALRHGSRIIGAALLTIDPKIDNHLLPGPTISIEYRNRGFGTHLLEHSLHTLRDAGLAIVSGMTRDISPAAKFLYPKFGGVAALIGAEALAAA